MTSSIQLQKYIDVAKHELHVALHYLRQHPDYQVNSDLVQVGGALARTVTDLEVFQLEYSLEERTVAALEKIADFLTSKNKEIP